nr:TATA binding protein of transcription factor IIE [Cryptomonas curvata]
MVFTGKLKIPQILVDLIKVIIYNFYCDLHIIVFELLLKIGYASEYGIAKEINVNIEKIRLVTNSLYSESFIKYEDRLFKRMKVFTIKNKQAISKRVYKIRYWFVDSNSIVWILNEKMKEIISNSQKKTIENKKVVFKCPRKICNKKYSLGDLATLPFNYNTGIFLCNGFLNLKVICGSELQEIENLPEYKKANNDVKIIKNDHDNLKVIFEMLSKVNHFIKTDTITL